MKTKKEIQEKIKQIKSDDRYKYPRAQINVNVYLALLQTLWAGKIEALKWVLDQE